MRPNGCQPHFAILAKRTLLNVFNDSLSQAVRLSESIDLGNIFCSYNLRQGPGAVVTPM